MGVDGERWMVWEDTIFGNELQGIEWRERQ